MPVVCVGQRGARCREHDIVAIGVEAHEPGSAGAVLLTGQFNQPRIFESHLIGIGHPAQLRHPIAEPGTAVRGAYCDDAVHACVRRFCAQPIANRESTHAVTYDQRFQGSQCLHLGDSVVQRLGVGLDWGENRLQVNRHIGNLPAIQFPRVRHQIGRIAEFSDAVRVKSTS